MKTHIQTKHLLILAGALLLAPLPSRAQAPDPWQMKISELPEATGKTMQALSQGAPQEKLGPKTYGDKKCYKGFYLIKGHRTGFCVDLEGKLLQTDTVISLSEVTESVRAKLLKIAGEGKIIMLETNIRDDVLVNYEFQVEKDGKIEEFKVNPQGEIL